MSTVSSTSAKGLSTQTRPTLVVNLSCNWLNILTASYAQCAGSDGSTVEDKQLTKLEAEFNKAIDAEAIILEVSSRPQHMNLTSIYKLSREHAKVINEVESSGVDIKGAKSSETITAISDLRKLTGPDTKQHSCLLLLTQRTLASHFTKMGKIVDTRVYTAPSGDSSVFQEHQQQARQFLEEYRQEPVSEDGYSHDAAYKVRKNKGYSWCAIKEIDINALEDLDRLSIVSGAPQTVEVSPEPWRSTQKAGSVNDTGGDKRTVESADEDNQMSPLTRTKTMKLE